MSDKCPICGSNMVEKDVDIICVTHPTCWDITSWCACGYSENMWTAHDETSDELNDWCNNE